EAADLAVGPPGVDPGLWVPVALGAGLPIPGRTGAPAISTRVADRVVVSGWQVYNNKGQVVERYEPFFDAGWTYQPEQEARRGRRVVTFYDPRGHVVRVVNPDGCERRVIFGVPLDLADPDNVEPTPWVVTAYDENDLAPLSSRPDGTSLTDAAPKAHHFTPATTVLDALERAVCHVARGDAKPGGSWY